MPADMSVENKRVSFAEEPDVRKKEVVVERRKKPSPRTEARRRLRFTGHRAKSSLLPRSLYDRLRVAERCVELNPALQLSLSDEEKEELKTLKIQAANAVHRPRKSRKPSKAQPANVEENNSGNVPPEEAARRYIDAVARHAPSSEEEIEEQLATMQRDDAATAIQALVRAFLLRRNVARELDEDETIYRELHVTQLISLLNKGMEIRKYPRNGRAPETRVLWLDTSGKVPRLCVLTEAEFRQVTTSGRGCKGVLVSDIAEIRRGANSTVFKRQRIAPDPSKCFSIITSDRTWDFGTASRKSRNFLVECLRYYVETVISPQAYAARGHVSYNRLSGLRMAKMSMTDVARALRFKALLERGIEVVRHRGHLELLVILKIDWRGRRVIVSRPHKFGSGSHNESLLLDDIAEIRPGPDCLGFRPGVDTSTTFAILASEGAFCLETSNVRARNLLVQHFQAFLRLYRHGIDG